MANSRTALFAFIACMILVPALSNIPKKYAKTAQDRAMYCDVCVQTIIKLETHLLGKTPEKSDIVVGGRIDSNGKRIKKTHNYIYSEEQVIDSMEKCCDDQDLYKTSKHRKMCEDFVHHFEDDLIDIVRKNEEVQIRRFCKKYVSKNDCKAVVFPSKMSRAMSQRSDEQQNNKAEL